MIKFAINVIEINNDQINKTFFSKTTIQALFSIKYLVE